MIQELLGLQHMKNSNGVYRGGTTLQRGTRKTFSAVNAKVNYKYKLGLRKTNNTGGGIVTIKGSWSSSGGWGCRVKTSSK